MIRRYCSACKDEVDTPKDPVKALRAFPATLRRTISALSPRQTRVKPRPGEWSAAELVAHFADGEIAFGWRLRMILAQNRPALTPFDQNAWASALNYVTSNLPKSLALFDRLRQANCDVLEAAKASAWRRTATHPERGEITLRDLTDHRAHHDLQHLAKLRGKIQRIRAGQRG
jgi:hypothetical protein